MAAAAAGNSNTAAIKAAMSAYFETRIVASTASEKVSADLLRLLTQETVNTRYTYQTSEGIQGDRPLELAIQAGDIQLAVTLVQELGANALTYSAMFQLFDRFFDPASSERDKNSAAIIVSATFSAVSISDIVKHVTEDYNQMWLQDDGKPLPSEEKIADLLHRIAMILIEKSRESAWGKRRHAVAAFNKGAVGGGRKRGGRKTRRYRSKKQKALSRKH